MLPQRNVGNSFRKATLLGAALVPGGLLWAVSTASVAAGLLFLVIVVDRRSAMMVLVASVSILGACIELLPHVAALWQFYLFFALGRIISAGIIEEVATGVTVSNWFV